MKVGVGKVVSILLALCMVFSLLPGNSFAVYADENEEELSDEDSSAITTDAFGINMDNTDAVLPEGTNPLGSNDEGWTTLFEVSELGVAFTSSSESKSWNFDYTPEDDRDSWNPTRIGYFNKYEEKNSVSISKSYYILDTAPVNAGDGKKAYTAYLGYYEPTDRIELSLLGPDGSCVSNTLVFGETGELGYLYDADGDYKSAYLSVAAGDFDGDGVDTIIAYVPVQRNDNSNASLPYIVECSVDPDTLQLKWTDTITNDVYTDLTKVSNEMPKNSKSSDQRLRNVPTISMTTGDTDRDGVDELVITANMNHPTDSKSSDEFASCVSIYDCLSDGWQQSYQLNTQTYHSEDNISDDNDSKKRLRAASSAVGNIMKTNGVDYPEVVTAGHVENASGESSLDVKGSVESIITTCTGCKGSGTDSVGTYQSKYVSMDSVGGFTTDGFKCGKNYPRWPLVPVAIGTGKGSVEVGHVVIADTVYEYNSGGNYLRSVLLPSNLESKYGSVNGHNVTTQWVEDIVVGNFNGNEEGKEQFYVMVMAKRQGKNQFSARIYSYYYDPTESDANADGWDYNNNGGEWYWKENTSLTISLCALDIDDDSTIGRLVNTETSWSEPEPFAVLEAAPYYSELGVSGETVYSTSQSSSSSTSSSSTLSSSVTMGYEASFLGFGAGMEAKIENSVTWETVSTESVEYSIDYTNDSGENSVVVARRQATAYTYEIYGADETLTLMTQGDLATSLITLDDYNEIVAQYDNLNPISESELATPGDPFSYRSSTFGLNGVASSAYYSSSAGTGSQTHSISESTEEENSCTYDMNFTFETWATCAGAKAGVGAGAGISSGTTTVTGSGKAQSGTVAGTEHDGYSFNWRLIRWMIPLSGNTTTVPVIGYMVDSVEGLPAPPINLSVDASTLTQTSATLTWENAGGNRSCETYYIYQVYADGTTVRIGEIDGSDDHYDLTNLSPNTSYTYAISAYTSTGSSKGESVLSDEVVVTTLPEGVSSVEITDPLDVSVKVGGTATFKTDITVLSDNYRAENHQWQMRTSGGSWEDISGETGKTLTLSNLQLSDDGTQVRCAFKVSYSNATSAVTYYSNPATLSVGAAPVTTSLKITGYDENNDNDGITPQSPYMGLSEYWAQNTTEDTVDYDSDVVLDVENEDGEIVLQLTVYSAFDGDGNLEGFYGYDSEDGDYYELSQNADGSYTVGDKVDVAGQKDVFAEEVSDELYPDMPIMESDDEEYEGYYLVAEILTDAYDDITGIVCYWYDGNEDAYYKCDEEKGTVGEPVDPGDVNVYDVYYLSDDTILLGICIDENDDDDDDAEEEYQYYLFTIDTQEEMVPGTEEWDLPEYETVYIYKMQPLTVETVQVEGVDFSELKLETVTETKTKTVTTTSLEKVDGIGTQLTLTATVMDEADGNPAVGAIVDFQITNLTTLTMETVTATVDENGIAEVNWTASTDGLYSIQFVVRKDENYALTKSDKQYYEAGATYTDDTTEYRLQISQNGQLVDGSIDYGDSMELSLLSRDVTVEDDNVVSYGEWKTYSGEVTYSYAITGGEETKIENSNSFKPQSAGSYAFYANVNDESSDSDKRAAMAALNVNPLAIAVTPMWTVDIPLSADDITLVSDIALVESPNTDEYLKEIIDITSEYFEMTDDQKAQVSGQYMIYLGYISEGDDSVLDTMNAFRTNYLVSLKNASFTIKKGSARVDFSCGVDGTISGMYADNDYVMVSGSSKTEGTTLSFVATPDDGYSIAHWTINGTDYEVGDELPDGMRLDSSGKKLVVDSFDLSEHTKNGVLTVYVEFVSTPYNIVYEVENGAGGTVSAVTGTSATIESGDSVAKGADVILTAVPDEGYTVSYWSVNGVIYTWDDTSEEYRGTVLTLSNISGDEDIRVFFKEITGGPFQVTVEIVDEDGNDASYLAEVSAKNKETLETVELPTSVVEDMTLTFDVDLYQAEFNKVSKWEISTDNGQTFSSFAGHDENTASVYNIEADTIVRLVLTNNEKVTLNYEVQLDSKAVEDENVASLTAYGNGYMLESGNGYEKHISLDFTLTIGDEYYLIGWDSDNDKFVSEDMSASIDELLKDTKVVVTIAAKPVVTVPDTENGTITVKGTQNGKDIELTNGESTYVDPGTSLTVTLTPNTGYVVSYPDAEYTDGSGDATDEMTYVITGVIEDLDIDDSFVPLDQVVVDYGIVTGKIEVETESDIAGDTESEAVEDATETEEETNVEDEDNTGSYVEGTLGGSLNAYVTRKGLPEYNIEDLQSGDLVYVGSDVTFVAVPDDGWYVKQWTINGEVYVDEDGMVIDADTISLSGITSDTVVVVTIVAMPVVTVPDTENGTITVKGTQNGEDIELTNGESAYVDLGTGLTVTLTPNTGYIVSYPDAEYTDGSGDLTDEMTYVIIDVGEGLEIDDSFVPLDQVVVDYGIVTGKTEEDKDNTGSDAEGRLGGSLNACVTRKGLPEYNIEELESGDLVYVGSDVTFVAVPSDGWHVKQWTVNNEVYVDEDGMIIDADTLSIYGITSDTVVTVEFEEDEIVEPETEVEKTADIGTTTKILHLRGTAKKSSATLKWNKVKNADGYKIYKAKCGKKLKLVKTIKNGSKKTAKVKKLKKGTCYKFVVKAYKTVDGKDIVMKKSNVVHVATAGGKFTNVKKVKINKSLKSVNLTVGKTKKLPTKRIKKKVKLVNAKKKLRNHSNVIHYRSNDNTVATVNKNTGKIKAKGKGSCKIYVYAANGQYVKVKVTVK